MGRFVAILSFFLTNPPRFGYHPPNVRVLSKRVRHAVVHVGWKVILHD